MSETKVISISPTSAIRSILDSIEIIHKAHYELTVAMAAICGVDEVSEMPLDELLEKADSLFDGISQQMKENAINPTDDS